MSSIDINELLKLSIFKPSQDVIDDALRAYNSAFENRHVNAAGQSSHGFVLNVSLSDGRDAVIKAGRRVSQNEALAMEYVRQYTTIPIPKVHAVFTRDEMTYLVMDRAAGVDLSEFSYPTKNEHGKYVVFPDLTPIIRQLNGYIDQLRLLGAGVHHTALGNWPTGPFCNAHFLNPKPDREFHTLAEFHDYWQGHGRTSSLAFDPAMLNEPIIPTLSHGEFVFPNIRVKDGQVVAVLDWETFGWYPAFWDPMMLSSEAGRPHVEAVRGVVGDLPAVAKRIYRLLVSNGSEEFNCC